MPAEKPQTREYCAEQVRGVDREKRTIEIVFSDFSLDTYQTRFDQSGWDFTRFKKNPVILAFHNDRKFVVANALPETIRVVGQESRMTIRFPDEGKHPEADIAFHLYADGFMRGVSVGFLPLKWEDVDETDAEGRSIRVRVFRKIRLDEVSLVAILSNENALAVRCRQMKADPEAIKQRTVQFEEALNKAPAFEPQPAETAQEIDAAEHEKFRSYYEKKQPANRAATKAMEKFFKARGETQPGDEVAAWERMAELIETPAEKAPEPEPAKTEEKPTPQHARRELLTRVVLCSAMELALMRLERYAPAECRLGSISTAQLSVAKRPAAAPSPSVRRLDRVTGEREAQEREVRRRVVRPRAHSTNTAPTTIRRTSRTPCSSPVSARSSFSYRADERPRFSPDERWEGHHLV